MSKRFICSVCSLFLMLVPVQAASLYRLQDLDFGVIVIRDNVTPSTVTLTRSGRMSSTGSISVVRPGSVGRYLLTDLPPFTRMSLQPLLPIQSQGAFAGGQILNLTVLDLPSELAVAQNGEVEFSMGGTLETSATGINYANPGEYPFVVIIELVF